jgi:hypothetical protein
MIRARGSKPKGLGARAFNYAFWEPAHFIMERKMLLTLKERAEAHAAPEHSKAGPTMDVVDAAAA